MKAIQFTGANELKFHDVLMPEVPNGWGLIKVSHAGICGTDLNIFAGTHPRAKAPLTMGHEFSGEMASDAGELKKGDHVTVFPLISCGKCTPCTSGNAHVCNTLGLYGIDCAGGMGEYVAIPIENIVKLPDNISGAVGAFIEPIAVAVHTLRETGFIPGDDALVFGCGTIGLCISLTLKKFGASNVVMVETDKNRAAAAVEMGFTVLDPTETDVREFVLNATRGEGFKWVFDCAGVQPVADLLFDVIAVRGKMVIVASYKKPAELPLFKGMVKELSVHFVRVYRLEDFKIACKIAADEPNYAKIITHILPASCAQEGFDLLTKGGTGAIKVIFEF